MAGLIPVAKAACLRLFSTSGMSHLILESRWRRERLLILCYHGLALEDEDRWDPHLYMPPALFRRRLEALRRYRCNVLSLSDGLRRLHDGTLPPRSVAITFDDGGYDFYALAWPMIREFGFPVTLYFTTWYCQFNRPVFDVMCQYLLWKARSGSLTWPEVTGAGAIPLETAQDRLEAENRIKAFARENALSGKEKDDLLGTLAARLNVDYDALCRRRLLHIMTEQEAAEVARQGVDFQLHTHRHRVFMQEELFTRELDENRAVISRITGGRPAEHFCYPDGFWVPRFAQFLESQGVVSATTCQPGMASRQSNRWLLPRLVDSSLLSDHEFAMWISGVSALLPRRTVVVDGAEVLATGPVVTA